MTDRGTTTQRVGHLHPAITDFTTHYLLPTVLTGSPCFRGDWLLFWMMGEASMDFCSLEATRNDFIFTAVLLID